MESPAAPTRIPSAFLAAVVLAFLSLATAPAALAAQGMGLALGAGWYQPGGNDFDDTDAGFGYHGSVGLALTDRVQLGLGAQWSRHDVDFSTDDYDVVGVYAEPRLGLGGSGLLRPYLAARLAWVRKAISVAGVSRTSNGVAGAGELGVGVELTPRVALEGGISLGLLSFGDFETDDGTLADTDSSGRVMGLRMGLRVTP